MKTITKTLLCILLTVSLMLSLCACGKRLEGTYILSSITYPDGTVLEGKELETEMSEVFGMELSETYVTLKEDGTGVMCVYGFDQEIGYEDGKFWYLMDLESGLYIEEEILEFDEEGELQFKTEALDADGMYDDIGSVLKIKQIQTEKRELLESLEMYYRVFFLGETQDEELQKKADNEK